MGSASSKFKKYLQHGDEYAAMQVFQNSAELRRSLQPNCSYGDHHHHNTPMHYASKHGMKHLIRVFLNDLGGNPNIRNARGQTALHCVCQISHQKSPSALERRSYSVILLLSWRGPLLPNGERERVEVAAKDVRGNTALHYASANGLKRCVEYLVAHGADVLTENFDGLTAYDLASRENHGEIVVFLESKMTVFNQTPEDLRSSEATLSASGSLGRSSFEVTEADELIQNGPLLRSQDLQEAKDQLIMDMSLTLSLPKVNAEAILRQNEWSKEVVLENWRRDPIETCSMAGIQPPQPPVMLFSTTTTTTNTSKKASTTTAKEESSSFSSGALLSVAPRPKIYSENSFIVDEQLAEDECLCEVCCDLIDFATSSVLFDMEDTMTCKHKICLRCWKLHLTTKLQQENMTMISCPAPDCKVSIPISLMEKFLISKKKEQQQQQTSNSESTSSSSSTKSKFSKSSSQCPGGCGQSVNYVPESGSSSSKSDTTAGYSIKFSHSVDCGHGHFFCWECRGLIGHAPVSCLLWDKWGEKCAKITMDNSVGFFAFLINHVRPCPHCGQNLRKTDGCNKVKCEGCNLDFCWVCLENWKKHPMCNRYVEVGNIEMRFIHFYIRYRNHYNSYQNEKDIVASSSSTAATDHSSNCYCPRRHSMFSSSDLGTGVSCSSSALATLPNSKSKFYENAAWELVKARTILSASYVYGYFHLEEHKSGKSWFELMQHELEEMTEKLSEMLQRPHLRTPKRLLMQTCQACVQKRNDFLKAVYNGLQFEDPWMNRLPNNPKRVGQPSNSVATTVGKAARNAGAGGGPRQIWTKTLSYPNKKCQRPGCRNSCNNVRSSVKNFCTPSCAHQAATLSKHNSTDIIQIKVLTLPRSSKSEDDLLSQTIEGSGPGKSAAKKMCGREGCGKELSNHNSEHCSTNCSHEEKAEEKVKAAGYRPLVNEGGSSTTSEDTLKNTVSDRDQKIELTSQRKTRPKLFRQQSFEIDSDTDTSLADVSNIVSDTNTNTLSKKLQLPTVQETETPKENNNGSSNTTAVLTTSVGGPKKKRPALTIKIQNSSFCEQEDDLVSELEKSPNLYISGVNISRSPGGRKSLSPNVITNNRNRSSSLVVPPVIRRKGSSGGSPGSKSLHLSPLEHKSTKSHVTLFTFPEPSNTGCGSGNSAETSADSGLSSILHVHERYLSSEDFHEALFFERSPKSGQRKRSRKNQVANQQLQPSRSSEKKLSVTQL